MAKKIENMMKSILKQRDAVQKEYDKLLDMNIDFNEERQRTFAEIMRSLPRDKSTAIIDFFVDVHFADDCNDDNLKYAMPNNNDICPRCALLWLAKGKSKDISAVELLNNFVFGLDVNKIIPDEEDCDDDCDDNCGDSCGNCCGGECHK